MTGNKKVKCNVCYREIRSDNVKRHMKQHTKKNESNPVTNISVTNNYNTISGVSTERKDEDKLGLRCAKLRTQLSSELS